MGQEVLTLPEMIAKFTSGPREILGLPNGTLKEGAPGDVTILDPGREITVDPDAFESNGRNTPFAGWKLKGCAVATVVGGEVRMSRLGGEMTISAKEALTP